ncbi:outer membrane beta-barrel protein [Chitinibacter sp. SCUT-21]|uniref:outer membrane beta-barrel protein n=1 Tax=Chitinibacter sp. SCUT-21 TaxID=2970891 RepID=UPI0035A6533F
MTKLSLMTQAVAAALSLTAITSYADEQPKQLSSAEIEQQLASPNSTQVKPSFSAKEFADTGRQNPAPIEAGPFYVYPMLGVSFGYDDNITRAADNEISSAGTLIAPSIVADLANNGDRYVVGYNGRFVRYFDSKSNNTDSNELQFQAQNNYSARLSSVVFANVIQAEDQVGSTDSRSKSPDEYRQYMIRGLIGYGAQDATGRIEADATFINKDYLNNRQTTASQDQETLALSGRFFYRIAPKTRLLLEARYQDINYDVRPEQQNSDEYRLYAGANWDADAYFLGTVKLGMQSKDFDDPTKKDFRGFSYEAMLRFMPRTYSSLDLTATRTTSESTGLGDYLLEDIFSLTWNHAWSNFISSRATASYTMSDYVGSIRNDDTLNMALGLDYKVTRWLKTGAEIRFENRDSNIRTENYDRAIYMLNFSGSL